MSTSIPQSSGIYLIVCLKGGKVYIGSTNNLHKRWRQHRAKLNKQCHDNIHLQRAWDKYGAKAFQFKILEYCTVDQLDEREEHHIRIYKRRGICYNMSDGGKGRRGVIASHETRLKMSEAANGRKQTLETRMKLSEINKGKKHTPETLAKLSAISIAHAKSRIAKIAKAYIVTSPDGEETCIKNLAQFCRDKGLTKQGMTMVAQGKQYQHKGWKCRYDNTT